MNNKKFVFLGSGLILTGIVGLVMMSVVAYQQMTFSSMVGKSGENKDQVATVKNSKGAVLGVSTTGEVSVNTLGRKVTSIQASVQFPYVGDPKNLKVVAGISNMEFAIKNIRQDKNTGMTYAEIMAVNQYGADLSNNQVVAKILDKNKPLQTNFSFNQKMCKIFVVGNNEAVPVEFSLI